MPCPYFLPAERTSIEGLPHPERLSLGSGYSGKCTAADLTPSPEMLHDCNLGYANCPHLPAERAADAIRLLARRDPRGLLTVHYVCEAGHTPVAHGVLIFDASVFRWREPHADARIQRMAECCVEALSKQQ